ncbi:MAG TPA: universal stress protein [Gemmatimonadales bacterium]|nr:universal stress protein [Gemmatimonadales bacterium]
MAWRPIIVGVDGTPESLRAAELAARIASAARAPLIPVHAALVIPAFTDVTGMEPVVFSPELQNELMRSSRAQITRALEQVLPPAAVERLDVQTGPGPFVLAEAARRWQAELVVLGGKQHGALARGLGRSTAHYLVRKLDVPVLVVGDSPAPITKVLVAVDLSPTSAPTVAAAQRLASPFGARLRLLHVIEPLRFTALAPASWDELGYERRSEELFDRFVTPFKDVPKEDRVVRRGIPAEMIADEAGAWHANLVVAGSHGKGWLDRILVGSTTERLVTELPTSILVVPSRTVGKAAGSRQAQRSSKRSRSGRAAGRLVRA